MMRGCIAKAAMAEKHRRRTWHPKRRSGGSSGGSTNQTRQQRRRRQEQLYPTQRPHAPHTSHLLVHSSPLVPPLPTPPLRARCAASLEHALFPSLTYQPASSRSRMSRASIWYGSPRLLLLLALLLLFLLLLLVLQALDKVLAACTGDADAVNVWCASCVSVASMSAT